MEKLTERLLLREFTKQDVDAIAEFRRDPRYLEYYYRPAYTREECVRFVDKCIAWSKESRDASSSWPSQTAQMGYYSVTAEYAQKALRVSGAT